MAYKFNRNLCRLCMVHKCRRLRSINSAIVLILRILRDIILCPDQTVVCIVFEEKLIIGQYNLSLLLDLHIFKIYRR